jgi:hypothetical protein
MKEEKVELIVKKKDGDTWICENCNESNQLDL